MNKVSMDRVRQVTDLIVRLDPLIKRRNKEKLMLIDEITRDLTDEEFEKFKDLYRFDKIGEPRYFTSQNLFMALYSETFNNIRLNKFIVENFIYYSYRDMSGFNKRKTWSLLLRTFDINYILKRNEIAYTPTIWLSKEEEYIELNKYAFEEYKRVFGEKMYNINLMEYKLSK